jgi:hypothetical protein
MAKDQRSLWDKIWLDRQGRFVIWQTPNIWLIIWAVLTFASLFISGRLASDLSFVGDIFLVIWCLLEILKGVNYFRRLLGIVVLIFTISSIVRFF